MRWMSPTFWKYATRQMLRRPGRTLLTLFGIAVGVATIVAVNLTTHATRSAYHEMFTVVTGRASLEVVAEDFGGFDDSVVASLNGLPCIKAALPVIQSPAALVGKSGPVPVLVLGIDPDRDQVARDYLLKDGRGLTANDAVASGGVLLEAGFAEANGYTIGQSARMWTPTGMTDLPIVGLLEMLGPAVFN